jgi:predicted  nucleic acid-binding Zn-ribbon protein
MRTLSALLLTLVAMTAPAFGQSGEKPQVRPNAVTASCVLDRSDLQDEIKQLELHISRMQSRIVMIRNSAGTVQDPQVRNALQVDADMWQDEVDYLHLYIERLKTVADRCEAREKINESVK